MKLNDGSEIPQIGYGCFKVAPEQANLTIHWALEAGYRYFDLATRYENEKQICTVLRESSVPRDQLYLVSKLWPTSFENPARAIEYSLAQTNCEYLDSYYLHWPSVDKNQRYRAWEALLAYRERGLLKSIGVSNFTIEQYDDLVEKFGVTPVINQIELHPWYPQREICTHCRESGTEITAWGPIFRGHLDQVESLRGIAEKHGKSLAQITLRWHIQKGNIVIPKSSNQARIFENINIFDFSLDAEDMKSIDHLESGEHFGNNPNTYDGKDFILPY